MQHRMYLPAYGRFASPDPGYDQPEEDAAAWNLYAYCMNNPVTKTDPDGMHPLTGLWIGWPSSRNAVQEIVDEKIDNVQDKIGYAGAIPVIGEPIDVVNGSIYAGRGKYLDAGASFASVIPIAGSVVPALKIGAKYEKVLKLLGKSSDDVLEVAAKTEHAWSNKVVKSAAKELEDGATSVHLKTRSFSEWRLKVIAAKRVGDRSKKGSNEKPERAAFTRSATSRAYLE